MTAPVGPDGFVPLGRPVQTRRTGRATEVAEVPPASCPQCRASWRKPGSVQMGHQGQRTYRCDACTTTFVCQATPHPRG